MLNIIKSHNVVFNEDMTNIQDEDIAEGKSILELNGIRQEEESNLSLAELNGMEKEEPKRESQKDSENDTPLGEQTAQESVEEQEPPLNEGNQELILKLRTEIRQQIIDELKDNIISDAQRQKERILASAKKEAEEIFKTSVEQGIEEGIQLGKKTLEEKISQWNDKITYLADIQERKLLEINRQVVIAAVDVAEKVIGIRMEFDPLTLLPLTKEAVASLDTDEKITVCLSKEMPQLIEQVKREFQNSGSIKVRADDSPNASVYIETGGEILDASVATQLQNLKDQLKRLNFED